MTIGEHSITRDQDFADSLAAELVAVSDGTAEVLPDVDQAAIPLLGKLNALSNLLRLWNKELLSDFDLGPVEHQVLGILRSRVADAPAELARFTHQTRAGMTRTLDRLEARGLVERRSHATDRRRTCIALTRKGVRLTDKMLRLELAAFDELLSGLDGRALAGIDAGLNDFIARFAGARRSAAHRAA